MALLSSSRPSLRARVLSRLPATLQAAGGIQIEKLNGIWTVYPDWSALQLETTFPDAGARQLWMYNPDQDEYTRLSVQALIDNLPVGPTGPTGPSAGVNFNYSTTTTDADPGAGIFRFDNATVSSATAAYIDNADADGADITAWLDSFDDSTSPVKGTLTVRGFESQDVFAIFDVSGSVVDGTGYRKLTLAYVSGGGTFVDGELFSLAFSQTGNIGATGPAGAGLANVVDDTTPQLGGMLDVNGFALGDGTLELLKFVETGAAVNEVTITNAATGSGPTVSATGDDTDIDLNLAGKGTGVPKIGGAAIVKASGGQNLTGGFTATSYSAGSKTTGTFTPDPANGNIQHYTNGGAHTLAPPTNPCTMILECTNASAGALTTSGFSIVDGDTYSNAGTRKHIFYITKTNSYSHLNIRYVTGT